MARDAQISLVEYETLCKHAPAEGLWVSCGTYAFGEIGKMGPNDGGEEPEVADLEVRTPLTIGGTALAIANTTCGEILLDMLLDGELS